MNELRINTHSHTEYSNLRMLDSTNKLTALIDKAVELGDKGVAITDHESLSGHIKAMQYVDSGKKSGKIPQDFKLILGNEIYLVDEIITKEEGGKYCPTPFYHFILLAKDEVGHRQLRELSTGAWSRNFYNGKMERVPTLKSEMKRIIGDNKGHLIAQTACLGGQLAKTLLAIRDEYQLTDNDLPFDSENVENLKKELHNFLGYCLDLFGEDFYLEMQPSYNEDQIYVNKELIKLSEKYNIKTVITTDAHYLNKKDRPVHEAYLNSKEDKERELADFYETTYMMDTEELHLYMDSSIGRENVSLAFENSLGLGDKVEEYSLYHTQVVPKPTLPEFELQHSFESTYEKCEYIKKFAYSDSKYDQYFLYLVEQGWFEKEYREDLTSEEFRSMMFRINEELEAIWETSIKIKDNVASYYLTSLEIVNMMWDDSEDGGNSLVGCSRGSVAAFYVAYLINLQQLNPMTYGIPFWRHLSKERPEMPDVDIDTEASKRQRIIEATRKKYGEDRVLNICTFKTEGSKSAMLTSARGLGIEPDVSLYLSGLIPVVRGATTSLKVMINGDEESGTRPNTEFINECNNYPNLLETALAIEGLISGRSIHASGVIVYETDSVEYNAMMKAPNGQPVTQWCMDDSTFAGGLKFDYLTIKNLDSMHICLDFLVEHGYIDWQGSLRATYTKYFHPNVLDYDSVKMWEMAENLEIVNLFQFQTMVGSQAIQKVKPRSLLELGTANSVMRLSVEEGEQPLDTYARYRKDISEWYTCMREQYQLTEDEIHLMEKHLKKVDGMASTQEEVMLLSMDEKVSNFSMLEANKLRKSIAKKKKVLQDQAKELFFRKGMEIGTSDNLLNYIWNEVIGKQLGLNEGSSKTWETHTKAVC